MTARIGTLLSAGAGSQRANVKLGTLNKQKEGTENNTCFDGGLYEHDHGLTYVDTCKNKESHTKKFVTTNHTTPSPSQCKGFAESFQGVGFFFFFFFKHISLPGPETNLSLLQTHTFLYFGLTVHQAQRLCAVMVPHSSSTERFHWMADTFASNSFPLPLVMTTL